MPHLPPAHHETSKHDSQNETKVKEKNETVLDSNSNLAKSMSHHNQTKELTTWFLIVVFIPLQLLLGHVVECCRDHIRLLHDLPNGTTLAQEIVASLVLPIPRALSIDGGPMWFSKMIEILA
jgi:hypothetical protein